MGDIGGEEPEHWNTKGQKEKILVSVRLRPSDVKENSRYHVSNWECINVNTIIYKNNLSLPDGHSFHLPIRLIEYLTTP